jgi:hypothetical protein
MGDNSASLDYSRMLHQTLMRWYDNADAKANILLALDGALVSFLTGALFVKREDLGAIVAGFDGTIWVCLAVMAAAMALSILSALGCLWSRITLTSEFAELIRKSKSTQARSTPYPAALVLFFGTIWRLDVGRLHATLAALSPEIELEALAHQIHALSRNVFRKHLFANFGFVLFGVSLIAFLASGVAYVAAT